MRMISRSLVASLAVLALFGACKDEEKVEPQEVRSRTSAAISNSLRSSLSTIESLSAQQTLAALGRAFESMDASFASMPSLLPAAFAGSDGATLTRSLAVDTEGEMTPELIAAVITQWLDQNVFADDNLESEDGSSAVFLLPGEKLCPPQTDCSFCTSEPCAGQFSCQSEPDPDCIKAVNDIQVRVRATLVGDKGVDLAILIGATQQNPVRFELRESSLAIELDIGAAKVALSEAAAALGEVTTGLPATMVGVVRGELVQNGEQNVSFIVSVLSAIAIEGVSGEAPFALRLAAAQPLYSLSLNGIAKSLSMALSSGALDIIGPFGGDATETDSFASTKAASATQSIDLHIDGASYAADLAEGDTTLTIRNIGLGQATTTLKRGETTLVAVDLNADGGRTFDLTVTPSDTADTALFAVTPGFSLSVAFNLQALADLSAEPIEPQFANETYGVSLTGEAGASIEPVPGDGISTQGGIKVLSGLLRLTSSTGASVEVPSGQCLMGNETPAVDAHPLLGYFKVGACQ